MSRDYPHQPPTQPEGDRNAPPAQYPSSPRPLVHRRELSTDRMRQHETASRQQAVQSVASSRYTSSTDPLRTTSYTSYQPRRSTPDMVDPLPSVPQWQPDEDVSKCHVCGQGFSLFFRKHHCRKCGKVVCGDCSRHRITLPHRYIVQPPWGMDYVSLGSQNGESVRVCNPCVPDPWTPTSPGHNSLPRQHANHRYSMPPSPSVHHSSNHLYFPPQHAHRRSMDATQRSNRNSAQFFTSPLAPFYQPHSNPAASSPQSHRLSAAPELPHRRNFPLPPRPDQEPPTASSPQSIQPVPRPPRRIVKEEDECPVCGIELAPGEELREQHITSCIASRFGSPDPSRGTPTTPNLSTAQGSMSSGTPPISSRVRAQSYRSRGLYQYKATEKDCTDNDGQEQECPICFEEFQPGDTLGRLECLCRFHHSCIREWWVRKGPGMCPVHASHE